MDVFISWSRSRSRRLALLLKTWIELVVPQTRPWCSRDLEPGARWALDLATKLGSAGFGILCMTPENLNAPWLHFEAGAISGRVGGNKTCPLLFRVQATNLPAALGQFQAISFNREGMWRLAENLSTLSGDKRKGSWERTFEKFWPDLEKDVNEVLDAAEVSPFIQGFETLKNCAEIMVDLAKHPLDSKRQSELVRDQVERVARNVYQEVTELGSGRFYTNYWNCTVLTKSIATMKDRLIGMTIWEQDCDWWRTEDAARFLQVNVNAIKNRGCKISRIFVYSSKKVTRDLVQELDKHWKLGARVYLIHRSDIREADCRTCALIDNVLYYHAERDSFRGIDRNVFFIDKQTLERRYHCLQVTLTRARRWNVDG